MGKGSDVITGIVLGILGGAIAAYLLSKLLGEKANCPVCGTTITKGSSNTSICPRCRTNLRWN